MFLFYVKHYFFSKMWGQFCTLTPFPLCLETHLQLYANARIIELIENERRRVLENEFITRLRHWKISL
jgi:hypothetical protein